MNIQASAQSQVQSQVANSGAAPGQDASSGDKFDDALAGAGNASAGGSGTGADPSTSNAAVTGTSPSALTARRLAELAAAAANSNGASVPPAGEATAAGTAGPPQGAAQGKPVSPSAATAAPTAAGTPVPTADPDVALDAASLLGPAKAAAASDDPAPAGAPNAKGGGSGDTSADDAASPSPSATGPATDLMAFLTAAVAGGTAAPTAKAATAGSSPPSGANTPVRGGSTNATSVAADPDSAADPNESVVLSDITIESHLAPTAGKTLGVTPDDDAKTDPGAVTLSGAGADAGALTPMRTITNGVLSLASQATAASTAAPVPDDATAAVPTAARTMTLQLSPAHLGTVSVRLHVTGQTLDVELSLSDQQTLGLVSRDRDALAGALRDQNYDLHTLVIQGADGSTGTSGDQYVPNRNAGGGNSSANGGWSAGGSRGDTGQQGASGSHRQASQGVRDDAGTADGGPQPGVGALFV